LTGSQIESVCAIQCWGLLIKACVKAGEQEGCVLKRDAVTIALWALLSWTLVTDPLTVVYKAK